MAQAALFPSVATLITASFMYGHIGMMSVRLCHLCHNVIKSPLIQ